MGETGSEESFEGEKAVVMPLTQEEKLFRRLGEVER